MTDTGVSDGREGADVDGDGSDGHGGTTETTEARGTTAEVDLARVLDDGPVLFFDGVCNLCNGAVQFVVDHDPRGRIRFASLQSDVGRAVLDRLDLPRDDLETVVLVEGTRAYTRSAASIRVCELLGGVYRLASVGWVVPRGVRDRLYDVVAEHRYQWFGRKDQCMVPTPELRSRFVDSLADVDDSVDVDDS
ncbi:thiol-disulfide oxidoreductase DCC family protein [Salinigranum salinum]|uniref:thiol-disulfide oxidoreductase DCC family protein n=1 Tax=Salinigranum salinum TaxID=1364937 RepID=UPI002AA2B124|nr:thiol-disulfide oxidoreductase DCC family protein [Salinigranum salinum]